MRVLPNYFELTLIIFKVYTFTLRLDEKMLFFFYFKSIVN